MILSQYYYNVKTCKMPCDNKKIANFGAKCMWEEPLADPHNTYTYCVFASYQKMSFSY